MKKELCAVPVVFNDSRSSFGNAGGLSVLEEIRSLRYQMNMMASIQDQIRLIRLPVLQEMANWPMASALREARNTVAHGGQVLTDVSIIESETDPAVKARLELGFAHLYHIPFTHQNSFRRYKATVNLMNLHANLSTLEIFHSRNSDLHQSEELLNCWISWNENGNDLQTYPFTSGKAMAYNRLIRRYEHSLPRNDFCFGSF